MKMNKEVKDQFNKVRAEFVKVHKEFGVVHEEINGLKTDIRHLHILMEDFGGKLQAIAENFGTLELHRKRLVDHDERISQLENTRPMIITP
jgi:archaellum component FlaC